MGNETLRVTRIGEDHYRLEGELRFSKVAAGLNLHEQLSGGPEIRLELDALERVDSAGLSLMLHWRNQLDAQGRILTYSGIPAQLHSMIRVYELGPLFVPAAQAQGAEKASRPAQP